MQMTSDLGQRRRTNSVHPNHGASEIASELQTRCLRCPDEALEFLGTVLEELSTQQALTFVRAIERSRYMPQNSEQTASCYGTVESEQMVKRLNQMLTGGGIIFTWDKFCQPIPQWICTRCDGFVSGYVVNTMRSEIVLFPDARRTSVRLDSSCKYDTTFA